MKNSTAVSREYLAECFGYSNVSRLSQLKKDGLQLVERSPGQYDFKASVLAYAQYMQRLVDKRNPGPVAAGSAEARKALAEAEIAELKAREAKRKDELDCGKLLYKRDVAEVMLRDFRELKQRCHKWLQECMDIAEVSPMQREQRENEFTEFFNNLNTRKYRGNPIENKQ